MKLRVSLLCVVLCFAVAGSVLAQGKAAADPISGQWTGDWGPSAADRNQVVVDLKFDGKALTGTVNPGPNAIAIAKATFDEKTGAVHMEADAKGRGGANVHYVIDGKLDKGKMSGSWNHDNRKGDFAITKK